MIYIYIYISINILYMHIYSWHKVPNYPSPNPPISERTLFSNFDHFPHNTHISSRFTLFLWLFYWMGDQATSDVLFHFWHYGSTHAKSCYLSITITLQCFICNLASVYWDLTYDLVFLVLWFNVTYTYTHRGHINIY